MMKEVNHMPEYDFRCPTCGERFSARTSIGGREAVRCPKCDAKPEQLFKAVNVQKPSSCG